MRSTEEKIVVEKIKCQGMLVCKIACVRILSLRRRGSSPFAGKEIASAS